jgi:aspartyl aminopeptidase
LTESAVSHPAESFLRFIDRSPSPYHAIAEAAAMLTAAGFVPLTESESWSLAPGGAYFVVRGGKSLIAWRQGAAPPAEAGFRLVAAHSDSPVLKLRPRP